MKFQVFRLLAYKKEPYSYFNCRRIDFFFGLWFSNDIRKPPTKKSMICHPECLEPEYDSEGEGKSTDCE